MHFDDRLATVLRNPAASEPIARAQYRQLLDLLGTLPSDARSDQIDTAYFRLCQLAATIPASERAAMLREPVLRLRNPRLVAQLALAEPLVAQAAMARAELSEEQWLDLIPALPVQARGVVRHRRGFGESIGALLARLGVADRGLPPAETTRKTAAEAPVAPTVEPEPPHIDEIGAIVRRIEAFRKTRAAAEQDALGEDPRLPFTEAHLEPRPKPVTAFDFATDAEGRVVWAEQSIAPTAIGLRLAARDADSPVQSSPELLLAFRHRQPIAHAQLSIVGAPSISGEWRIDAAPRFDQPNGRFVGYLGRLRRPATEDAKPASVHDEGDRMRQILHELRTPVNAIQGFAEVIQQQLFGPTPHEYRALAATIAGDAARMLAGFEELDRLVKLDGGASTLEPGECDLLRVLSATIAQLEAFHAPRRSGLELDCDEPTLPVGVARAEAERMIWRLLATLSGATAPNEVLRLRVRRRGEAVRLVLALPASLAWTDDEALLHSAPNAQPSALAAGMFGTGFALRLAAAEARAAGGSLDRRERKLRLSLPALRDGSAAGQAASVR
jgi:signal transduction histidine kinase